SNPTSAASKNDPSGNLPPKNLTPGNGISASKKSGTAPSANDSKSLPAQLSRKRKRKIKNWSIVAAIIIIAGAGIWYFYFRGEADQLPFIRFATVEKGDVIKSVTATGTLQATTTVQVGSQVSGTIKALHADWNTRVKKGDLVAELDPTFYEAAVKSAQANFARAKADMEIAQRNNDRTKDLFDKNLVSKSDYDVTETALADAKATVQQLQAALDQANVNLSYTKIHAPISGIVTQRSVDVGQTVAASLSAPVLFIIAEDLTEMEVDAAVDEADVGQVKQGEDVTFTVDAFPGEKFHGIVKMVRLNPVITSNVVTYTVVITAQNKEEKLFPGMTATVTITNSAVMDVLRIPAAATRFTPPNMDNTSITKAANLAVRDTSRNKRDTARMASGHGRRDSSALIYRKSNTPVKAGEIPILEPVRIKMGLTDGMYTEIISSDKPLNVGDSIAVGSIMPTKSSGTANAPGTNPFGTPARPGGAAGAGGARR
ncbi:MAG: efflux RND transporter periplasmic adaptor subunit, partial [Candidatus Kapaibacterium sp.]